METAGYSPASHNIIISYYINIKLLYYAYIKLNQTFICYITYTDSLEGYWTNNLKTFTTHARLDLEFNQRGIDEWSLV